MALNHGLAFPASLAAIPGLSVFDTRADHASYSELAARNGSGAGNTVNLFMDSASDEFEYAASIVSACKDQTVYAVQCTAGPATVTLGGLEANPGCGSNAPVVTVTEGPSTYIGATQVATSVAATRVTLSIGENCALSTSSAVCTAKVSLSYAGTTSQTTTTATHSGTDYLRFDVAITAGAEKTASATAACTTSGASGLSKKSMAAWALTGVVGAVGFLVAA